ncbi:GntR family transcriptional regulator [Nocardiopsis sp. MG754419]|uniref:GntR family transcriptional regulator n=1 Tax=Nocardiopsis sp. MG754419 TaxID=2259865 RepID=UPI002013400B|nr:GntR family transcriptional regulator [Nocardiopsis sp. MG754419]MBR8741814.1 GntR family transcriptional regulator [Nocardiopsis sp. MG754419]
MPSEEGTPRSRGSTEDVYERLRSQILENRIAPGERVNIDALARELGVSQTPVREAIRQLEGDRLVVRTTGRGYRTTPLLDPRQLRELFEFRILVDVWAARSAAVNRLTNPGPDIHEEITGFATAVEEHQDIRRHLVAHDVRFHGLILSALDNRVVQEAYEQTHSHLHTFRLYPADADGRITLDEHRRIWAAIDACDPDAAETAMRDHLTRAFRRFARAFDAPTGDLRVPAVRRMYADQEPPPA